METITIPTAQWTAKSTQVKTQNVLLAKWNAFADSQAESKTLWFLIALVFQGVFFLPLPALLICYFNAPIVLLAITLSLFFANIIAGMGGAGIRTLLQFLAASVIIHILMAVIYMI